MTRKKNKNTRRNRTRNKGAPEASAPIQRPASTAPPRPRKENPQPSGLSFRWSNPVLFLVGLGCAVGMAWGIREYVNTADLRWSLGFGLRYPTPVGPIRLDLGLPIKRKQTGVLHFGLGHTF